MNPTMESNELAMLKWFYNLVTTPGNRESILSIVNWPGYSAASARASTTSDVVEAWNALVAIDSDDKNTPSSSSTSLSSLYDNNNTPPPPPSSADTIDPKMIDSVMLASDANNNPVDNLLDHDDHKFISHISDNLQSDSLSQMSNNDLQSVSSVELTVKDEDALDDLTITHSLESEEFGTSQSDEAEKVLAPSNLDTTNLTPENDETLKELGTSRSAEVEKVLLRKNQNNLQSMPPSNLANSKEETSKELGNIEVKEFGISSKIRSEVFAEKNQNKLESLFTSKLSVKEEKKNGDDDGAIVIGDGDAGAKGENDKSIELLYACTKTGENGGAHITSKSAFPPLFSSPSLSTTNCDMKLEDKYKLFTFNRNNNNVNGNDKLQPSGGESFKSSEIIKMIIEAIKSRQIVPRFEPCIINKNVSFQINPMICIKTDRCIVRGFSNVEKAQNDGIIRCLDSNRFTIDCIIQMCDLVCDMYYKAKLGGRWHLRRVCLRNKTLSVTIDKCLIYVQLLINTETKKIQFARFSPISQQQVRVKTRALSMLSLNNVFSRTLQRYFERYFATNVLRLEDDTRRRLDESELLNYDEIVTNTTLLTLFDCFKNNKISSDHQFDV